MSQRRLIISKTSASMGDGLYNAMHGSHNILFDVMLFLAAKGHKTMGQGTG